MLDRPTARAILDRFSSADPEPEPEPEPGDDDAAEEATTPKLGSFEVMNRTIDIAQSALTRHQLAAYPPDLLIEVPRTACRSLDFHRAAELIDVGRELTARALEKAGAKPV